MGKEQPSPMPQDAEKSAAISPSGEQPEIVARSLRSRTKLPSLENDSYKESNNPQVAITYYEEQGIVQINEKTVSLHKVGKHAKAGHDAMTIVDALLKNRGTSIKAGELNALLHGQEYVPHASLSSKRLNTAIDWLKKNIKHSGLPVIHHEQTKSRYSRYSLADVRIHLETAADTLKIEREDLIVCPDGRLIEGKSARLLWEMLHLPKGKPKSYKEIAEILYSESELKNKSPSKISTLVSATISYVRPLMEKYYNLGLTVEQKKRKSFLSTQPLEQKNAKQQVSSAEIEATVGALENKNLFTFPDGSLFIGRSAILTYLLLKFAPKGVAVTDLQKSLYDDITDETTRNFHNVRHLVKNAIEKHLSGCEVVRSYEDGEIGLEVRGFDRQVDLESAMTARIKETTVFSRVIDTSPQGRIRLTSDDPEIAKALKKGRPLISRMRDGKNIMWDEYSLNQKRALLQVLTHERGKPLIMLDSRDFFEVYEVLGNRNIERLFSKKHPEKRDDETTLSFFRRMFGLPEMPAGARARYRWTEMQKMFQSLEIDLSDGLTHQNVMPWIEKISDLYQNSFLGVEREEIVSEAYIRISEKFEEGVEDSDELILNTHKYLEQYVRGAVTRTYREKSIDAPISSGEKEGKDMTVKDTLVFEHQPRQKAEHGLGPDIQERIAKLLPQEQFLIYATAVEAWDFEIIAEEFEKKFKKEIDVDTLQELYQDALTSLREDLENG